MRAKTHRGRFYDATAKAEAPDVYRGVFDIDSSSPEVSDGVINEVTSDTYPTREEAEEAADAAAMRWIDVELDDPA
jgi:hypothetical protein